jgi:hypothetical protein
VSLTGSELTHAIAADLRELRELEDIQVAS